MEVNMCSSHAGLVISMRFRVVFQTLGAKAFLRQKVRVTCKAEPEAVVYFLHTLQVLD